MIIELCAADNYTGKKKKNLSRRISSFVSNSSKASGFYIIIMNFCHPHACEEE